MSRTLNRRAVTLPLYALGALLLFVVATGWLALSPQEGSPLDFRVLSITSTEGVPRARTPAARKRHDRVEYEIRNDSTWPIVVTGVFSLSKPPPAGSTRPNGVNVAADLNCTRKVALAPGDTFRGVMEAPTVTVSDEDWTTRDLTFTYRWLRTDQPVRDQLRKWYSALREALPSKVAGELPYLIDSTLARKPGIVVPATLLADRR